jgi:hypothetical protein
MNRKRVGQILVIIGLALIVLSFFFRYDTCPPPPTYNGTGPPPPGPWCQPNYTWTETGFGLLGGGFLIAAVGGVLALYRPSR